MSSSRELSHTAGSALDTAGRVECAASFQPLGWAIWPDLSPFAQGYVEALLQHLYEPSLPGISTRAFSDLAPETLAAILRDCERGAEWRSVPFGRAYNPNSAGGACFWLDRQGGLHDSDFPRLTVYLGDDGKVRTRPVTGPLEGRTGQLREDQ